MDALSEDDTRSLAAIWKVVAELTRENNQRDVDIATMQAQMDRVDRIDGRLKELATQVQTIRPLSEQQILILEHLVELHERRGHIDTFTEVEMEGLREALRRMGEWAATKVQIDDNLRTFQQWQIAYDAIAKERARDYARMDAHLNDIDAVHERHAQDVPTMRQQLVEWNDFRENYLPRVQYLADDWQKGQEIHKAVRVGRVLNLHNALIAIFVIVPASALVTLFMHFVFHIG